MAVLDIYTHQSWLDEDDDQDDAVCPPELLIAGWWSASADLNDE